MADKDWLSAALAASEPHLDDDGFTDTVMARLPRHDESPARSHDWIIVAAAAVGSAVVAVQFPFAPFLDLITSSAQIPLVGGAVMLVATGIALGSDRLRQLIN